MKLRNKDDKKKFSNGDKDIVLKKRFKIVLIIAVIIIILELVIMFLMHLNWENKIVYMDTLNSVETYNDYYLASGSSNFRYSRYNDTFMYEYEDGIKENTINRVYAEQAKLVKYDSEMNIIFESTFKTDYSSTFYHAISVDKSIYAVGSFVYDKKQLSLNTRDGLLAKYDENGKLIWSKNYQVLGDTEFKKVLKVEDGLIVIGQSIYENMEIGNHDIGGGIIVKYDFDGNIIWKNNFGGNKSGIFNDIVQVSDGYICVGKDATNYGLIAKFNFDGELLWAKSYANTDNFGMTAVKLKDDKLYIAGAYNVSEEKDAEGNIKFEYDACIFIYDLNGELIKTYSLGGSNDDRFNSLLLEDDSIIAIGFTLSKDIKVKSLGYEQDMTEGMIVKFDYEGKVLNTTSYSGKKNETLNDIKLAIPELEDKVNNTKKYVIVGYTNSKRGLFKGNNKDYFSKVLKIDQKLELISEN